MPLAIGAHQQIVYRPILFKFATNVREELVVLSIHFQAVLDDLFCVGQRVALEKVLRAKEVVDQEDGTQFGFHVFPRATISKATDGGLPKVLTLLGGGIGGCGSKE